MITHREPPKFHGQRDNLGFSGGRNYTCLGPHVACLASRVGIYDDSKRVVIDSSSPYAAMVGEVDNLISGIDRGRFRPRHGGAVIVDQWPPKIKVAAGT